MLYFENDYSHGAHPAVLKHLIDTNLEPLPGYGADKYCLSAQEKIRAACQCPAAQVRFLTGGTQTNQVVISGLLRSYEGVISAATGHVNGHEAGAIEYSGHKVLALPEHEGRLDAVEVDAYLAAYHADPTHEHVVRPGMVYISHPTEYGTLYSLSALTALSEVCRRWDIPLFMDGARLAYGLMSYETDLTLPDIARLCDVFYIGGTKVGALQGEALVFTRNNMPDHFLSIIKQRGALLAKGRLVGVQFDALFTDGLYYTIGRHAVDMAQLLKQAFLDKGYELFLSSPTNQQFVILDDGQYARLAEEVKFTFWEKLKDGRTVVRLATGFATTEDDIEALKALL